MATGGEEKVGYSLVRAGTVTLENADEYPVYISIVVCQDKIVLLDENRWKVKIHGLHDGKFLASLGRLELWPRDMCLMDAMTICVIHYDGLIKMMSIDSADRSRVIKTTRTLRLQGVLLDGYRGVVRFKDSLVVTGVKRGMMYWCIVSLDDGHVDRIHQICKGDGRCCRVTTKDNIIYISCWADVKSPDTGVYGFDILNPSQCKYKYKHQRLQWPKSIVINEDGNIFVCNGYRDFCIHQLTASCQPVAIFTQGIPLLLQAIFWDNGCLYGTRIRSPDIAVFRHVYQGSHKASEVPVSNERKHPVTVETAIQIGQGNVDQGQSSVSTEMPPSGPVPEEYEDDKQGPIIPVEILRMDDKSLQLYKKALHEGKEKVYNLRVMVVGQFGVGKTTLIKRLLGKHVDISERKSTEGIDVYKHCCKISLDTGEWIVQHEDSDQLSRLQRLMKLLSGPDQKSDVSQEQEGHREVVYERETTPEVDNTHMSDTASSSRSDQKDQLTYSKPAKLSVIKMDGGHGVAHSDHEPSTVTVAKSEAESSKKEKKDAVIEILRLINENVDKLKPDAVKYAALSIWDFAGQYSFYTTHQTFLSSRALYLLVIDLNQQITDLIEDECFLDMEGIKPCKVHALQKKFMIFCYTLLKTGQTYGTINCLTAMVSSVLADLVEIWMNSIHTCASSHEASIPHVILVGTHVDKLSEKSRKEVIDKYFKDLRYILKDKPTIHHLMDDIAVDNTQSDLMLETFKRRIFELASQQPHWGKEQPARWLPLEQAIMTLKASGAKVVARSLIEEINGSGSVRIEDSDELDLFLRFHHEMGTILYFSVEELREKIVLDPQWLIDALKSLITAEIFIKKYPAITSKWYELKETGKLTHELIDAIWTVKDHKEFHDNKDHILILMEKLNIIARPRSFTEDGNEAKEENYFLAPCMLQRKASVEVICPKPNDQMGSSPVLCYVFKDNFMPFPIFHRLIAACVAHWPIATKKKEDKQENQIFCGCCVFKLDQHHKLTLHFRQHVIFVRVTRMGIKENTPSSELCIEAREFITTNLQKIIGNLGQSLNFENSIQCPEYNGESVNVLFPVSDLKENTEVDCDFHDNVIESCNLLKFWFEDKEQSGDVDAWMHKNLGLQDVTQVSQAGKMKADIDQTEAVFVLDQLVQCAKSVGIIRSPGTSGTGFRVGPNYIMTAKHVVDKIIQGAPVPLHQQQQQLHPLGNTNVYIDFSYERDGVLSDENLKFYFEPELVYASDELDTVILKLKPDTKTFPPPLIHFHNFIQLPMGRSGYLIGHSRADIKKTDKYSFVMLTEPDINDRKKWSMSYVNVDGYAGIEDTHRVLFHCSFEKGASGAPGFWICPSDGQAYVELMLLCGYPTWYYDDNFKDKTVGIPNSYLIEQGVSMKSVFDAVQESDASLCKTIFPRDNWDEEMAPMD